jgi:hypothetical protein
MRLSDRTRASPAIFASGSAKTAEDFQKYSQTSERQASPVTIFQVLPVWSVEVYFCYPFCSFVSHAGVCKPARVSPFVLAFLLYTRLPGPAPGTSSAHTTVRGFVLYLPAEMCLEP